MVDATDRADLDEVADLAPDAAAQIMQEAKGRAQRELRVNLPALYALAGGGGFLVVAAFERRLRRS